MKGCQKKVIFLKNTGSYLFDEAYFIISREGERSPVTEESMIVEANRIIESNIEAEKKGTPVGHTALKAAVPFLIGAALSALCAVAVNLLF